MTCIWPPETALPFCPKPTHVFDSYHAFFKALGASQISARDPLWVKLALVVQILCVNYAGTILCSLPPTFHQLPSFPASPQRPSLSLAFHAFQTSPICPTLATVSYWFPLVSLWFSMVSCRFASVSLWFPMNSHWFFMISSWCPLISAGFPLIS